MIIVRSNEEDLKLWLYGYLIVSLGATRTPMLHMPLPPHTGKLRKQALDGATWTWRNRNQGPRKRRSSECFCSVIIMFGFSSPCLFQPHIPPSILHLPPIHMYLLPFTHLMQSCSVLSPQVQEESFSDTEAKAIPDSSLTHTLSFALEVSLSEPRVAPPVSPLQQRPL